MNPIPQAISKAVNQGLTLRDYAVLLALVANPRTPMTRQDIEEATGLCAAVVSRSTKRLVEMDLISRDKKHPVGGQLRRAAKYTLKP